MNTFARQWAPSVRQKHRLPYTDGNTGHRRVRHSNFIPMANTSQLHWLVQQTYSQSIVFTSHHFNKAKNKSFILHPTVSFILSILSFSHFPGTYSTAFWALASFLRIYITVKYGATGKRFRVQFYLDLIWCVFLRIHEIELNTNWIFVAFVSSRLRVRYYCCHLIPMFLSFFDWYPINIVVMTVGFSNHGHFASAVIDLVSAPHFQRWMTVFYSKERCVDICSYAIIQHYEYTPPSRSNKKLQ